MSNIIFVMSILSVILGIMVFIFLSKEMSSLLKSLEQVGDDRADYSTLTKKYLKTSFVDLEQHFGKLYSDFGEEVRDEMLEIKASKERRAIKEAAILLRNQDEEWYDRFFPEGIPDDEVVDKVWNTKYEPLDNRYTEFIEEVSKLT